MVASSLNFVSGIWLVYQILSYYIPNLDNLKCEIGHRFQNKIELRLDWIEVACSDDKTKPIILDLSWVTLSTIISCIILDYIWFLYSVCFIYSTSISVQRIKRQFIVMRYEEYVHISLISSLFSCLVMIKYMIAMVTLLTHAYLLWHIPGMERKEKVSETLDSCKKETLWDGATTCVPWV